MKSSKLAAIGSGALIGLAVWASHGQGHSSTARLVKLPVDDASHVQANLKSKPINGATVHVEGAFLLRAPATTDLSIVPVLLWPGNDPGKPGACGIVFLQPGFERQYLQVVSPLPTHADMCTGLSALGLVQESVSRPRLIALFNATAGHGPDYTLPYLLVWNPHLASYKVDTSVSHWLIAHRGSDTIDGVRHLLLHQP